MVEIRRKGGREMQIGRERNREGADGELGGKRC